MDRLRWSVTGLMPPTCSDDSRTRVVERGVDEERWHRHIALRRRLSIRPASPFSPGDRTAPVPSCSFGWIRCTIHNVDRMWGGRASARGARQRCPSRWPSGLGVATIPQRMREVGCVTVAHIAEGSLSRLICQECTNSLDKLFAGPWGIASTRTAGSAIILGPRPRIFDLHSSSRCRQCRSRVHAFPARRAG